MQVHRLPILLLVCLPFAGSTLAQAPSSPFHAPSGEFLQPTPASRFRQIASRDNLVHPPGYVTAPPDTFGEVAVLGVEPADDRPSIVAIAGLGPSWRVLHSFLEPVLADHHVLAITLAGYGGSSAPPMPPEGTSFAEGSWLAGARRALAATLDEHGLERPVLVAFYSDAARVAVRYALEHPERVGSLLVLSASASYPLPEGTPRGPGMDGFAQGWFRTVSEIMWPSGMWPTDAYCNDRALAEKTWWDVLYPSVPTAVRYTVETWADDLVPDLARLAVPTFVVSPGYDEAFLATPSGNTVTTRFHAGWEQAALAGAPLEHVIVPGARLLLWEDDPEELEGWLNEALMASR